MNKLNVVEHMNSLVDLIIKSINENNSYNNNFKTIEVEKKSTSNSLIDATYLIYKSYSFDKEFLLYKNKKLLVSNEICKITYLFEYNKVKDKLSIKIIESGVKKGNEKYFYTSKKRNILCLKNDGKCYTFHHIYKKPVLCNFKINKNTHSQFLNVFKYLNDKGIIHLSNQINSVTSYFYNQFNGTYNSIIKFKDVANASSFEEFENNTYLKSFNSKFCALNNTYNKDSLIMMYYRLTKKSINFINKNYYDFKIIDTQNDIFHPIEFNKLYTYLEMMIYLATNASSEYNCTEYDYYHKFRFKSSKKFDIHHDLHSSRYGNKIDIFNYHKSFEKARKTSSGYIGKNTLKYYNTGFKFWNFKKIRTIVNKYFKIDQYKFKVIQYSNDKDFVKFAIDNKLYHFNSKTSCILVYNNNEVVDIIYSNVHNNYFSLKNKNYIVSEDNFKEISLGYRNIGCILTEQIRLENLQVVPF